MAISAIALLKYSFILIEDDKSKDGRIWKVKRGAVIYCEKAARNLAKKAGFF